MKLAIRLLTACSLFALTVLSAETPSEPKPGEYALGPDSQPQAGVPKGKLEGPFLFRSQILTNTVRKYWVYVPAQYTADKPAAVLVFQDCLLYTSDAADERSSVDLGGRRIIKK